MTHQQFVLSKIGETGVFVEQINKTPVDKIFTMKKLIKLAIQSCLVALSEHKRTQPDNKEETKRIEDLLAGLQKKAEEIEYRIQQPVLSIVRFGKGSQRVQKELVLPRVNSAPLEEARTNRPSGS